MTQKHSSFIFDSITAQNQPNQMIFYKRQLEKNIIHCHQKQKLSRRRRLSLTFKIPLIYKSNKHTSIDFDQLNAIKQLELRPSVQIDQRFSQILKQNSELLIKEEMELKQMAVLKTKKLIKSNMQNYLNQKLIFFKDMIESKKLQKKQAEKQQIKEQTNLSPFDILRSSQNKFNINSSKIGFGSIMKFSFGFGSPGLMGIQDENNCKIKRLKRL